MRKHLLMSVAAAALIAGTSFATAQAPGGAAGAQQSAPAGGGAPAGGAAERGAPAGGAMQRENAEPRGEAGTKSGQAAEPKAGPATKSGQAGDMKREGAKDQQAQDGAKGGMKDEKSKTGNTAEKDMKPGEREGNRNADSKTNNERTTGQAAAGGKLTTEQRTKVNTVIRSQNIQPETNVNFSVSIGTRVPREVRFHPLPTEIISIYPDWRGYEFFLVRDEIIVVNPRTLEIVAVLDA